MEAESIHRTSAGRYRFVAPAPGRRLVALGLATALVLLVCAAYAAHLGGGGAAVTGMGAAALGVVVFWTVLGARLPQEVIVRGSLVMITRDRHTVSFDLDDPGVDVLIGGETICFSHYLEPWVVVRARDVDWDIFCSVVRDHLENGSIRQVARHRGSC